MKTSIETYVTRIRTKWMYGAEVWDTTNMMEEEKLQIHIAKKFLPCGLCTNDEAVRGELGLTEVAYVREMNRLLWWGRIIREPITRLTKQIYMVEKKIFARLKKQQPGTETGMWIEKTYSLLEKYGFLQEWEKQIVPNEKTWARAVKQTIHKYAEEKWREAMQGKPKLHMYRCIKKELKVEKYLTDEKISTKAKRLICGLRTGTNQLQIELDRYERPTIDRDLRFCHLCNTETEDEHHFMFRCPALKCERDRMMAEVRKTKGIDWMKTGIKKERRMAAFLGIGLEDKKMRMIVAKHVVLMWRRRTRILNKIKVV